PLLLIPQWFLSSRSMRASALVRKLAERHSMLLYDRRGTGESDKPGPPYSLGRDSRDLGGLIEALGLEEVVLIGHGVRGSQVALWYAGHFPDKVRAAVCIGGTPRWNAGPEWPYGLSEEAWARAFGTLEASDAEPPGASIAMKQDWQAAGRDAALDILRRTRDEDLRPILSKVTPPVLVVHLRGDTLVPFEAAQWLAESVPHGTLEVFDAPREIPMRAHEELARHIEEFLAG
ncbi:MAG: alpha/beta fold hydrolase, partial [Actinomycetota bacterium]